MWFEDKTSYIEAILNQYFYTATIAPKHKSIILFPLFLLKRK